MKFEERLLVIKFQEESIFTNTLPFTDLRFHFFFDKIDIESHHTGISKKGLLVNVEREMSDLLKLFQDPQKTLFVTNLRKIIVHVNFSKKNRNLVYFF